MEDDRSIDYSNNLDLVEEVTINVLKNIISSNEGGIDTFEPKLYYSDFADPSINFSIVM